MILTIRAAHFYFGLKQFKVKINRHLKPHRPRSEFFGSFLKCKSERLLSLGNRVSAGKLLRVGVYPESTCSSVTVMYGYRFGATITPPSSRANTNFLRCPCHVFDARIIVLVVYNKEDYFWYFGLSF